VRQVTPHEGVTVMRVMLQTEAQEGPMTVLIYVNASKQVGDPDHLKVFANADAAETWFAENDPEGAAFEYEVIGQE
jgi:hypothetical protein